MFLTLLNIFFFFQVTGVNGPSEEVQMLVFPPAALTISSGRIPESSQTSWEI